jgi:hypothetical protein
MTTRFPATALLVSVIVCALAGAGFVGAQPATDPPGRLPGPGAVERLTATVVGYLWSADSTPIPSATLRLRDVSSGHVALTTYSNENGEFSFDDIDGGAYVVEYVDARSHVLAVGSPFSVSAGETVSTLVRVGTRRTIGGFFTSTAAAVVASAATIGVTAVVPTGRPASPNR